LRVPGTAAPLSRQAARRRIAISSSIFSPATNCRRPIPIGITRQTAA
jgi:hypothetical protein